MALSINSTTGVIDLSASTAGTYTVKYTTGEGFAATQVTIENCFTNAYSLNFDGVNDTLRVTDSTTVPSPFQSIGNENSYTISFWMKSASTNSTTSFWYSNATLIEIRTQTSSGTHVPFSIGLTEGSIWFGRTSNHTTTDEAFTSTSTVNNNSWRHIVCAVNVDSLKIYIDGSLDSSHTFTTATGNCSVGTTSSNFQMAARTTNTGGLTAYTRCNLEEVAFFNAELSSSDVTAIYNSGTPTDLSSYSSLFAWYRMGDGDTYPIINDNEGSANASMTNMATDDIVADVP